MKHIQVPLSLKEFRTDLHIHSCLSPCGDLLMSPRKIVEKAKEEKLDIISITDHNSAENVLATIKAGTEKQIAVIPGIEITSEEEVHIIGLFEGIEDLLEIQKLVYEKLLPGENNEGLFGEQIIANENDEVEGFNKRLLIGATSLSAQRIVELIHSFRGLAIASHIDREGFSIIGQLGIIPENLPLDALEISPQLNLKEAKKKFNQYCRYPFVSFSDAHFLEDIAKVYTIFLLGKPTLEEIKRALREEAGRKILE